MSIKNIPEDSEIKDRKKKRPYVKPLIESEDLLTFGADCNGSTSGGRKVTNGPPAPVCNPKKLTS